MGKVTDDPRVTCLGKFLRRYFVDEIPQFINIARGEMSLVGIRPRSAEQWKYFPDEHMHAALQHKPGLCGVPYAHKEPASFADLLAIEREYLQHKRLYPTCADSDYLQRIIKNILLHGVRSR